MEALGEKVVFSCGGGKAVGKLHSTNGAISAGSAAARLAPAIILVMLPAGTGRARSVFNSGAVQWSLFLGWVAQ